MRPREPLLMAVIIFSISVKSLVHVIYYHLLEVFDGALAFGMHALKIGIAMAAKATAK